MNRRCHKKIRRAGILLLCCILCLTPCACSSQSSVSIPNRSILPPSLQALSFEEHMDISLGYWDIDAMVKSTQPDGMTRYIEELFNITLHPMSVTWSNYKERYQFLSFTNSLPDMFATVTLSSTDNNDSATYSDLIRSGSVRPLPEDMSAFPILKGMLEDAPSVRYTDGQYYAIPRVSYMDPILGSMDAAILVRRDWMENLGYDDPQSFEEFAQLVSAFANEDPDGNGLDDTIGYNVNNRIALGKWVILGIAPECNVYSWVEKDGRFVPSWTTDAFKDVVLAYRRLYETGGLDPDFYSKSPTTIREDFASGRLGAMEYKSFPMSIMEVKEVWDTLNDKPFEECVDVLPIFPAPDGIRYSNSSNIFWSETYISSSVDGAKLERILALFEFLMSEEGQKFCHYGIEGEDYIMNEDGSYECLLDLKAEDGSAISLSTALTLKYPSSTLFANLATWDACDWNALEVNEMNSLLYGEYCMELGYKSATWFRDNTVQLERPYDFLNFPKEATDQFSTNQAFEAFVNCIIGKQDPVAMWEDFLEEMREDGLEEYIDRQNELYREYTGLSAGAD